MAGVSGRFVRRTALFWFDGAVVSWICQPEEIRGPCGKKKTPKQNETSLIQELLGKIIQGFQEIIFHLIHSFHLRIPSVIIHT